MRGGKANVRVHIRRWSADRNKMTKGITLTKEEFKEIKDAINV